MKIYSFSLAVLIFSIIFTKCLSASGFNEYANKADSLFAVSGTVVDSLTKEPVELANVILFASKDSALIQGAATDQNGRFMIPGIVQGKYFIKISFVSYKPKIIYLSVENENNKNIDLSTIYLAPVSISLGEVHVAAEKEAIVFEKDKIIFNVGKDIASLGGSAVEVLENAPLVTVDFDGNASIIGKTNTSIFINGISTSKMGIETSDILKTISAHDIEKVEIIEHPNAEYGSETSGGVINIILKKKEGTSVNGSIDANGNSKNSFSPSASMSVVEKKWSLRGSVFTNYMENNIHNLLTRESVFDNKAAILNQSKNTRTKYFNNAAMLTYLYNINKYNNISIYTYYKNNLSDVNNYTNNILTDNINILSGKEINSVNKNEGNHLSLSAKYQKLYETKGQQLNIIFSHFNNRYISGNNSAETLLADNPDDIYMKNNSNNRNHTYDAEINFNYSFNDSRKLYLALHATQEELLMKNNYYSLYKDTWNEIEDQKIFYNYYETEYAFSAAYTDKLWCINYTLSPGIKFLKTKGGDFGNYSTYHFTGFYPNAQFYTKIDKEQSISFFFMRRLQYPYNRQLNPKLDISDSTNITVGNPDLKPAVYNDFTLSYMYNKVHTIFTASLDYMLTNDIIEKYIYAENSKTTITTYRNIAQNNTIYFRLTLNQDIGTWFKISPVFNIFKTRYSHSYVNSNKINYTLFTNATISHNGYYFQSKFIYVSPSRTAQINTDGRCSLDIAAKKGLFNNKLIVYFRIKDVLNSIRNSSKTYGNGLYSYSSSNETTRIIMAGITYYFQAAKDDPNIKDDNNDAVEDDF